MDDLMASRWRGQRGRLEVWYTTFTDPATGIGVWLHHELIAPTDGRPAYAHGWATVFPIAGEPIFGRFGPTDWLPVDGVDFLADSVRVTAGNLSGQASGIAWDLQSSTDGGSPLFTFPRWVWRRELLPAAQVVPVPNATYRGTVRYGDQELRITAAPGCTARIYGHGNARRWAWLHADLGNGDVLEVVAAVSTRPGLRRLRPLPLVRLRLDGVDYPSGGTLLAARRIYSDIGQPTWRVWGRIGRHQLDVIVTQPPDRTVAVPYTNPDGSRAICHNSERADADITWRSSDGTLLRRWHLKGNAHAEVGNQHAMGQL
ncbi:hypothetical protein [Actinokineospora sp. HUAS TT18]|uniref:hypothetical protein n=1 Tax=Actinokineospora sp. HUAS TT18 TaxID=3447451 RepID=UPI003F51B082